MDDKQFLKLKIGWVPALRWMPMYNTRRLALDLLAGLALAAFVIPEGLGHPIFIALRDYFKTEIIAAGALAVLLALAFDALLVLAQRVLTPWVRARAS